MTRDRLPPVPFFVHVMKTAGGTFREQLKARYGDQLFPVGSVEGDMVNSYTDVDLLRRTPFERHGSVGCYSGHYPYCAVRYVPRPVITLTLLRDPIERIVSYLRHCKQRHPQHQALNFEQIYEDPFHRPCLMHNHQVKVFAMVTDDEPESVMDVIDIDDRRLNIAKEQLAEVAVIGRQEEYGRFLDEATARLGWTAGPAQNVHLGGDGQASVSLRRRIVDDNQADIDFYEYAVDLISSRREEPAVR